MSTIKTTVIQPLASGGILSIKQGDGITDVLQIDGSGRLGIRMPSGVGLASPMTINHNSTGTVMTGPSSYGGIHLHQSSGDNGFVGITSKATSNGTQGGFLIQGSGGFGTKLHLMTTNNYTQGMKHRVVVDHLGNVGIGTLSPTYQFELSTNSAAKPTSTTWTISSDARLKTVLGNWERGLEDVCRLRPVKYRLNGKYGTTDDGKEHVSVIAQEATQVIPEMVGTFSGSETPESDPVTLYNLDTNCLQWCFVNAIKELKAIVEAQAARIAALEGK